MYTAIKKVLRVRFSSNLLPKLSIHKRGDYGRVLHEGDLLFKKIAQFKLFYFHYKLSTAGPRLQVHICGKEQEV